MKFTFYYIPGLKPGDIINKRLGDLATYVKGTNTYDMQINGTKVTISTTVTEVVNLVGVTNGTDSTALTWLYYVVNRHATASDAGVTHAALELELAALQTYVSNDPTCWLTSGWTLNQYSLNDNALLPAPQSTPCATYRTTLTEVASKGWSSIDLYAVAMSVYSSVTSFPSYTGRSKDNTDPVVVVLTDPTGTPLTGITALDTMQSVLTDMSGVRAATYRIQMIPTELVSTQGTVHNWGYGDVRTYYKALVSFERSGSWWDVSLGTRFTRTDIYHKLAYGDPQIIYSYAGQVLGKFAIFQPVDGNAPRAPGVHIGVTLSQGVNVYVKFIGYTGVHAYVLGMAAIPIPDVIGVTTGLASWYETVGRNLISQTWTQGAMTLGLTLAGAVATVGSGGSMAPLVAGALGVATNFYQASQQIDIQRRQASQQVVSVGGGPTSIYVASPYTGKIDCYIESIEDSAVTLCEQYFRAHGYSGAWYLNTLPLTSPPRSNYWRIQGSCNVAYNINRTYSTADLCVSQSDFVDALNAEAGRGATLWQDVTYIGNYATRGNPSA